MSQEQSAVPDADLRPRPIIAVVGATASGKTALSYDLAERVGGEIVNTDAMAIYRGMDIGTAKPSVQERRGLAHHLFDIAGIEETASVARFQRSAREVIADVRDRGRTPILVGGSALYTRAILDRFEFPGTDPSLRARLTEELERVGVGVLHARLREADPQAAEAIRPDNGRRIVRALEVIELTGEPFSATLPVLEYADPASVQIGVDIDRAALAGRIEARVQAMFAAGFVAEVERLLAAGLAGTPTASRAIGYREVADHLAGRLSLEEAMERTVIATRRFARRQDQWFRKDSRVVWVGYDDPGRVDRAVAAIADVRA